MESIINRILNLKHWEVFTIFTLLLFFPTSITQNNFFNIIIKISLILALTYGYLFTVLSFIISQLEDVREKQKIKRVKIIFYTRSACVLSIPTLFLFDNLVFKITPNFLVLTAYLAIIVPLAFASFIAWFYFLSFISRNLSSLETRKTDSTNNSFGYLIAFLFIPLGIFIVQPILNELYRSSQQRAIPAK